MLMHRDVHIQSTPRMIGQKSTHSKIARIRLSSRYNFSANQQRRTNTTIANTPLVSIQVRDNETQADGTQDKWHEARSCTVYAVRGQPA